MPILHIAIYGRKSRFNARSESVSTQITLCREHCDYLFGRNPENQIEYTIYDQDEGYSGKNTRRPDFQRMMEDIKAHKIDILCVYRLDRISRSVADFCQLLDLFQRYHVSFVSVRENFDTTTPMGRAMVYFTSVMSQLERETLAERVRDNVYELAKTGRWLGGLTPTGFDSVTIDNSHDSVKRTAVMLDPLESELSLVRSIYARFEQLGSLSKLLTHCLVNNITSRNGVPFSRTTLRLLLTNPVYCVADAAAYQYFSNRPCQLCADEADFDGIHGLMPFNRTYKDSDAQTQNKSEAEWIIAIGKHPGTIPGARWVHVQEMLEQNKELGKAFQSARTETALLSGLIRCGCCGSPMRPKVYGTPLPDGSRRFSYVCTQKDNTHRALCSMENAPGLDVDKLVISYLSKAMDQHFQSDRAVGSIAAPQRMENTEQAIAKLEKEIAANQRKIDNVIAAIADGAPAALHERLYAEVETLTADISKKKNAIAELNSSAMDATAQQDLIAAIRNLFSAFDDSFTQQTYDEKRRLIRTVVDSVIWDGQNVTINTLGERTFPK